MQLTQELQAKNRLATVAEKKEHKDQGAWALKVSGFRVSTSHSRAQIAAEDW